MMLECAAEQTTEITADCDEPGAMSTKRGVCAAADAYSACGSHELRGGMALLPTRGRTHWRHGGGCRSDMILQQEEGRETFFERSFLRDVALFWNSRTLGVRCVALREDAEQKDERRDQASGPGGVGAGGA